MYFFAIMAIIAGTSVGIFDAVDKPKGQVEIQHGAVHPYSSAVGMTGHYIASNTTARIGESVEIKPLSEFKFRNQVHQAYDYSCGSAALATLLRFYVNLDIEERQVMEGMWSYGEQKKIVARRGFSLLDMKRFTTALGLRSAGYKAELADLLALKQPAVVPIEYAGFKHFVVLREIRDGHVYVADPSMGNLSFTVEQFEEHWDGKVLFVVYPKNNEKNINFLALSDEDLRVFDYDQIRHIIFAQLPQFHQDRSRDIEIMGGGRLFYKH